MKYAAAVINIDREIICLCVERVQTDECRARGWNSGLHSVGVIMV